MEFETAAEGVYELMKEMREMREGNGEDAGEECERSVRWEYDGVVWCGMVRVIGDMNA